MKTIISAVLICFILLGCKKEEMVTVDFEIYSSEPLTSYNVVDWKSDKTILSNYSPIGTSIKGGEYHKVIIMDAKHLYKGSVTGEDKKMVIFNFPNTSSKIHLYMNGYFQSSSDEGQFIRAALNSTVSR